MHKKPKTRLYADDTPLTKAELERARPFRESPPGLIHAVRASIGRPIGRTKTPVHFSLDSDLVATLRGTGKGWQTRANAILREGLKMPPTQSSAHIASRPAPTTAHRD